MKLNWFSPLKPARTGVANFTSHVLPALAARAEVTLWTDQREWDPALETHARVRTYDGLHLPWREVNEAAMSVFNLGDNASYDAALWQLSRQHAGLVILHSLRFHHLFAGIYRDGNKREEYLAIMNSYYGKPGHQAGVKFLKGALPADYMAQHFPLTPLAVESALGLMVHWRGAMLELKRYNRWPVAFVPMPFPATPADRRGKAERFYQSWGGSPYCLLVFGFIEQDRRLDSFLEALAAFSGRDRFRLHVYGELWDPAHVQTKISGLGIDHLVCLHGSVGDAQLDEALASAHLVINLRFPTTGEASEAQLRLWDHALPSMVTQAGWYATLSNAATAFVRPEREIQDIQTHLQAFLDDPSRFYAQGQQGRRILETEHTTEAYCDALVAFATDLQRVRARALAYGMAERVSAELSGWFGTSLRDDEVRKVAEEIVGLVA
jgi:glycosyltransferase involved in cell wall biosynthesis